MSLGDKSYTTEYPVTMYEVKANWARFSEKKGHPSSVSVFKADGNLVTFEDKYIHFTTFQRAVEVLQQAITQGVLSWEDFLGILNQMWALGLR